MCRWQVKLCDPSITHANLSALEVSIALLYSAIQMSHLLHLRCYGGITLEIFRKYDFTNIV